MRNVTRDDVTASRPSARPRQTKSATDPIALDVHHALAAKAHEDADGCPKRSIASARSARRWRQEGKGSPCDSFGQYLMGVDDPFRVLANVRAVALASIETLSRAETITEYRKVVASEKAREAENTVLDLTRGASWLDRAAASERDAGVDLRKAALERRLAQLRVTDAEVWA